MDENVDRTHASLSLVTALLDLLKRNGTITDQELEDIFGSAPNLVRTINPNFSDRAGVNTVLDRVREALD